MYCVYFCMYLCIFVCHRRALCRQRSSVSSTRSSCRISATLITSSARLTNTRRSAARSLNYTVLRNTAQQYTVLHMRKSSEAVVCLLMGHRSWSCCRSPIDWSSPGSFPVALSLEVPLWGTRFHQGCLSLKRESCCWSGWEDKLHKHIAPYMVPMQLTTWPYRPIRMKQRIILTATPSSTLLMETIIKVWEATNHWDKLMNC